MAYGWEGEKVRLVPIDIEKHLDNYVRWLNDPEITQGLLIGDIPMTRLAEREWMETQSRDMSGKNVVFAIETLEGKHIGASGVHQVNHMNGDALTGTFIGDRSEWGKGYATDSIRVRSAYCFEVLGLRVLRSAYIEGNERSRRMQISAGYVEIGRWPKLLWKRGAYRDEILTCLTRERWLEMNSNVSRLA
ncbi:MAG: GNAT family protein [Fimbriimonadaceae bacterium]